jgi:N-acetylglucosaminyldiphosphoundecaprenol N-acetyl-beta-D-mannosaminyltransferase
VTVLGHDVHPVDLERAAAWALDRARSSSGGDTALVVTLNPEIVVRARDDDDVRRALARAELTVADGVGVLMAARLAGHVLPGRVAGVELVEALLALGGPSLRVAFVGGRPGVAEAAAERAARSWGTVAACVRDGYFDRRRETERVAREIGEARPHLVLAGLGEGQERFLAEHLGTLGGGVAIGVGGTLDVLSGSVRRAPELTRRLGVEWAWRVGLDPARWHRFPRLARFALLAVGERRRASRA